MNKIYEIKELIKLNCDAILEAIDMTIEYYDAGVSEDEIFLEDIFLADDDNEELYMHIGYFRSEENHLLETDTFKRSENPELFDRVLKEYNILKNIK